MTQGKTTKPATGSPEWIESSPGKGCWHARLSIPGQKHRPRTKLQERDGRYLDDKERDRDRAKYLTTELAERVRSEAFEVEARAVERASAALVTVEQHGTDWTSGELLRRHGKVSKLRVKKSVRTDVSYLTNYIYPFPKRRPLGAMPVATVT